MASRCLHRLLFIALAFAPLFAIAADPPRVVQGTLDLRHWNFQTQGDISLNGNWHFAWRKFVDPAADARFPSSHYFPVPSVWDGKSVGGTRLSRFGYASYGLTILLPKQHAPLELILPEINMASQVWANGRLLISTGNVGKSASAEVAHSIPKLVSLPNADIVHLVIYVSNFYHMEGGIAREIKLDLSKRAIRDWQIRLLVNIFTVGALFFMGFHYLVMHFNSRDDREYLLYGTLAMLFLIRILIVNKIPYLFFMFPQLISTRLSYLTTFMIPPCYLMFLRLLYPQEISRRVAVALLAIGASATVFSWFTPASVFTNLRNPAIVIIQLIVAYTVIAIIIACFRRRADARIVLAVVLIFSVSVIYDTLVYERYIYSINISPYGFLVFMFGHAAILGRRTHRALLRESAATHDLAELSKSLQSKVESRTTELVAKVAQLERQELELETARHVAEMANLSKTRFLASASHDLRQSVHAIGLFVELLNTNAARDSWQDSVTKVRDMLEGLDRLLVELGEVSSLESGSIRPNPRRFPIQTHFRRLQDEFELLCRARGLRLRIVPTSLWCISDPEMFDRLLRNLLANAVKYTDTGRVLLGCRRHVDSLRVEVWDTGCGIPEESRQAIFEEFHRLDEGREKAEGVGLGLAIVRQMALLLEHEISVRSWPGHGSCFALTMPLTRPGMVETEMAAGSRPAIASMSHLSILFIDDDANTRLAIEAVLAGWGCKVRSAENAAAAERILVDMNQSPDLIISDYELQDEVNGMELMDRLFVLSGKRIPVLIVTAAAPSVLLEPASGPAYPVLLKPVDTEKLRLAILRSLKIPQKVQET